MGGFVRWLYVEKVPAAQKSVSLESLGEIPLPNELIEYGIPIVIFPKTRGKICEMLV
jgi:hypothetical protein